MTSADFRREAVRAALMTRSRLNIDREAPLCPFDAPERLGVEVKFRDETSIEGMYCRTARPTILVSTHRPAGRRAFSCGHELGHHVLGHGTSIDEIFETGSTASPRSPVEEAADLFAATLLMPKPVVERIFKSSGISLQQASPIHMYRAACCLGVGYDTLLTQLRWSLRLLNGLQYRDLSRWQVKQLKAELIGREVTNTVWPVDRAWFGRPVDVEVGDIVVVPPGTRHEGNLLRHSAHGASGDQLVATRPGIGRLFEGDWSIFVRVQRFQFIGRSIFRHLEDPDAE